MAHGLVGVELSLSNQSRSSNATSARVVDLLVLQHVAAQYYVQRICVSMLAWPDTGTLYVSSRSTFAVRPRQNKFFGSCFLLFVKFVECLVSGTFW